MLGERGIVGRERELAALVARLDAATAGRGSTRLICGEPGIGKSSLVSHLAQEADDRGFSVAWGRCWESGGAPAFWPWIEAIRDISSARSVEDTRRLFGPGASVLSALVPEVADLVAFEPAPPLEAPQAQFRLFDAVASFLGRASEGAPSLIILEDLHVAEPASVALLDFVARTATRHPLVIVGTYRVAEAKSAGLLDALARPGRAAETCHLDRLDRDAVAQIVETETGAPPSDALVDRVASTSEGNPLFAIELARLLASRTDAASGELSLPAQITAVIAERVERLPPETAASLRRLSVLGRELTMADAQELEDEGPAELEALLSPAVEAGLLTKPDASSYRFTHTLVGEALHQALDAQQRAKLHFRVAEALRERYAQNPDAPLSRIAHHYVEAGALAGETAIDFKVRAAERALAVLAHEEAAELYGQALEVLERVGPGDGPRKCALLLSLGHALLRASQTERGEEACRQAARLARKLDSATLFARAALEYGSKFTFGVVDPELVSLLEEALALLGDEHAVLRAKVLARLAAARQPAIDPRPPMEMAREAIVLAREHGDDRSLLAVIRSACSALMDVADPRERIALNTEYVELARRLDEPAEVLRGHSRLVFDHLELGDIAAVSHTIEQYARIAEVLAHPSYLWVASAFRALTALMGGRLAEAAAHRERARAHGEESGDGNVLGLFIQQIAHERLAHDDEALAGYLDVEMGVGNVEAVRIMRATFLRQAGKLELLAEEIKGMEPEAWAATTDAHLLSFAAEIAIALEDVALARSFYDALLPHAERNVSWGMVGLHCDGPVEHWLAMLAWTLGEHAEASRRFARATEIARSMRAPLFAARSLFEHGKRLSASTKREERQRGAELLSEALKIAIALEVEGLVRRIEALGGGDEPARPQASSMVETPAFVREGDVWAITFEGETVRVRNTKGMEILARLVAEPDREFHVVDLAGAGPVVEEGSTGEVIDAQAREAYRKRASDLRAELEEATEWNDSGRAVKARAELEALEAELRGALGLGGRARQSGVTAERARTNVKKRISVAQRKIAQHHPGLAAYLERTVSTGVFCAYSPL